MIKVNDLAFSYRKKDRFLFHDLSFEIGEGETMAILGPNGVGKTTLLRCLMNFLSPQEGEVELFGKPAKKMTATEFWKNISYVPQAKRLVFGYSALNMVVMGLSQNIGVGMTPKASDYEKAYAVLERFGIADIADQSCNTLSGGQLQMVLIARALVKKPKLLIMDEPESGLDMKNQMVVLQTIEALTQDNLSIILNTHYPDHALRCAQKTLLLGKNRFLFGSTDLIISENNIRKFFGVDSQITSIVHAGKTYQGIVPMELYA